MFMLEIKICIRNIGVQHSLEKNETVTMFFLKTPFLVLRILFFKTHGTFYHHRIGVMCHYLDI